ncbi:MAG: hypothetical protein KDB90_02230 [Planctomycetes bacterium]|nr:hypothetical protein [Planctomycetota bacterium]
MGRLCFILLYVLTLAACGKDERTATAPHIPAPTTAPTAKEPTPPKATPVKAEELLGSPQIHTQPQPPTPVIGFDFIAEARRCLADGDTRGYQTAIDRYNSVLKHEDSPFTVVRLTANTITYLTSDGKELTVNGWTDAMPGG